MRHEVPQFIDIKDKIIGPFTFYQSLYLIGGFFGWFAIYYVIGHAFPNMPFMFKAVFGIPPLAFGVALAFVEINKRPFIKYIEAWFYFLITPKKYIWKKEEKKDNRKIELDDDFRLMGEGSGQAYSFENKELAGARNKRSRLKDLANSLDMEVN